MNKLISAAILVLGSYSFAASLNCQQAEFKDKETVQKTFTVQGTDNPHGEMTALQSQLFPEVKGFVALIQKDTQTFAVLQLRSDTLNVGSSSQHELVSDGQYLQQQLIVPTADSAFLGGVSVSCTYSK